MPFGIDKSIGGDSPENVKFVENCVKSVLEKMPSPHTEEQKVRAIRICKAQLKKSRKG